MNESQHAQCTTLSTTVCVCVCVCVRARVCVGCVGIYIYVNMVNTSWNWIAQWSMWEPLLYLNLPGKRSYIELLSVSLSTRQEVTSGCGLKGPLSDTEGRKLLQGVSLLGGGSKGQQLTAINIVWSLSRYGDGLQAGRMGFDSQQGQEFFLFSISSRPAPGPMQTPVL
jgi:hypothetical protein